MTEWKGRPAFILAGGPSVASLDLSRLAGQLVVAINSAWRSWPQADMLFYADARWWSTLGRPALGVNAEKFGGEIVTVRPTSAPARATIRRKISPANGLSSEPGVLAMEQTAVSGAINEMVHRGSAPLFLLGVDGQMGAAGKRHHHGEAYPWPLVRGCFDKHAAEFAKLAPSLKKAGVDVFLVGDSAHDVWPKISFNEALRMCAERVAA